MNWLENILFQIIRLLRKLPLSRILRLSTPRSFAVYFKDFDKIEVVRRLFGEKTDEVLKNLQVDLSWIGGYMFIDNSTGHLVVSARYLHSGDKVDIYLDVIHELCHVRQFLEGMELFDRRYSYVERPTEIEAYRYTVQEARRLGLSDKRICEYLKTEWISNEDFRFLAKAMNVKCQ